MSTLFNNIIKPSIVAKAPSINDLTCAASSMSDQRNSPTINYTSNIPLSPFNEKRQRAMLNDSSVSLILSECYYTIRDISINGLSFFSHVPITAGANITATLERKSYPDEEKRVVVEIEVVYVKKLADLTISTPIGTKNKPRFLCGAKFLFGRSKKTLSQVKRDLKFLLDDLT